MLAKAPSKKVHDKYKKIKVCPHCHAAIGTVKRIAGVSTLKIVHEKYILKHMHEEREKLMEHVQNAIVSNPVDLPAALCGAVEDILPTRARAVL